MKLSERRRKPGSDLVRILIGFRDGFQVLSRAQFWFSRRQVFRNIFRGCFRGKLPVNNGAHEIT